jgi:hypothetical protein
MKTRYSAKTGAFYPLDIHYPSGLPADIIEVPLDHYEAAMAARAAGNAIAFVGGKLIVTPPPPIPFEVQAEPFMAEVRTTREAILNRLAGMGMAALVDGDTSMAEAITQARRQLLDITEAPEVQAAISSENMPALEDAVKVRYKAIAAGVPLEVRNAFNKVSL